MGKTVVKLAQPGYDVHTASDENLIFSSEWPLLKIYKQGPFKLTADGFSQNVLAEHNLGYVPMFMYFGNNIINNWLDNTTPEFLTATIGERSEFNGPTQYIPQIDTKTLIFNPGSDFKGPVQLQYIIFALDLTTPYTAPAVKLGKQPQGAAPSTVFKIAKPGKSASSHNLEDFSIHSHCRSPLVHAVAPMTTKVDSTFSGGWGATYYHNLGYVPIFFTYIQNGRYWYPQNSSSQADEQKITFNAASEINLSVVVLKDPFEIDYSVQVNL